MLLLYLRHTTYCFTYTFGGAQTCKRERELDPSHGLALEWLRGREVEEKVGEGVSRSAGEVKVVGGAATEVKQVVAGSLRRAGVFGQQALVSLSPPLTS
jgi:hypothetical protein